jgi:hypothetical protein
LGPASAASQVSSQPMNNLERCAAPGWESTHNPQIKSHLAPCKIPKELMISLVRCRCAERATSKQIDATLAQGEIGKHIGVTRE